MSTENNHYSKRVLLKFVEMDLFVDDMIAIDRHLDECAKCRHNVEKIRSNGSIRSFLAFPKVFAIVAFLLLLFGLGWWANNQLNSGVSLSNEIETTFIDSLILDSIDLDSSELLLDEEQMPIQIEETLPNTHVKPEQITSKPATVIVADDILEKPLVTKYDVEQKNIIEENKEVIQETKKESIEEESVQQEPAAIVKKKDLYIVNHKLALTIMEEPSAIPTMSLMKFNQNLNAQVDFSGLKFELGDHMEIVLNFEVDEKGTPVKVVNKSCSNQKYCDAIISFIKSKTKWSSYVSDDYVEYKTAKVKVTLMTY